MPLPSASKPKFNLSGPPILGGVLLQTSRALKAGDIPDPVIEANILIGFCLKMSRAELYGKPERRLADAELARVSEVVGRRLRHEPSAYILGYREFYGLEFEVDPRVLIPRPETELLVDKALEYAGSPASPGSTLGIADIGTGCGCIAVSLARNLPEARIFATDISSDALSVARINCIRHSVGDRITLLHGDLLGALDERAHLVVANLPYISNSDMNSLPLEVKDFEPCLALDGGKDGLDLIASLLIHAGEYIVPGGCLLLEIGGGQASKVIALLGRHLPNTSIEVIKDLAGIDRVIKVTL